MSLHMFTTPTLSFSYTIPIHDVQPVVQHLLPNLPSRVPALRKPLIRKAKLHNRQTNARTVLPNATQRLRIAVRVAPARFRHIRTTLDGRGTFGYWYNWGGLSRVRWQRIG